MQWEAGVCEFPVERVTRKGRAELCQPWHKGHYPAQYRQLFSLRFSFLPPSSVPLTLSENITSNRSCKPQLNTKLEIKQKCSSFGAQKSWAIFLMLYYSNWNIFFSFFFPTASLTELIELNVFCGARAPLTPVTQDNQGVISLLWSELQRSKNIVRFREPELALIRCHQGLIINPKDHQIDTTWLNPLKIRYLHINHQVEYLQVIAFLVSEVRCQCFGISHS